MKTNLNLLGFDLAKRLKDIGFNYEVEFAYNESGELFKSDNYINEFEEGITPCPTAEIAIQYLREEKELDIFIARIGNVTMPNMGYAFIIFAGDDPSPKFINQPNESYEVAQLVALDKAIKFINGVDEFDVFDSNLQKEEIHE